MSGQTQEKRSRTRDRDAEEYEDETSTTAQQVGSAAVAGASSEELDDLLSEIDDVLAENEVKAEEYVANFVQVGGQ